MLKPGGVQVYTVPLLHSRSTRQSNAAAQPMAASLDFLPPSYHGNEGEFPVVWEFGSDFLKQRKIHISELHYENYWRNKNSLHRDRKKAVNRTHSRSKGFSYGEKR